MKHALGAALAVALGLAGCAGGSDKAEAPAKPVITKAKLERLNEPGCYTVDLFDVPVIAEPDEGVRPEHAKWLGHWAGGEWEGSWCHELIVTSVAPDGRVELLDLHAPSATYSAPATAFRRTGRIFEDGTLRFAHGTVVRRYAMHEGRLLGQREGDGFGTMQVVLSRAEGGTGLELARN